MYGDCQMENENNPPIEQRSDKGYVYVMWCEGFVKIGMSRSSPIHRLDAVQIANPFPVELLGVIESDDAPILETELHIRFRQFHVRGEWFKIPDEILRDLSRRFVPNPPFKMRKHYQGMTLKRLVSLEFY